MNISLSKAVKAPSRVAGVNPDGQQVFVVDKNGTLTAKAADSDGSFTVDAVYWTTKGQSLLSAISAKMKSLIRVIIRRQDQHQRQIQHQHRIQRQHRIRHQRQIQRQHRIQHQHQIQVMIIRKR